MKISFFCSKWKLRLLATKKVANMIRHLVVFSEYEAKTCFLIGSHVEIITRGSKRAEQKSLISPYRKMPESIILCIYVYTIYTEAFRNIQSSSLDPGNRHKFLFGKKTSGSIFDRFQLTQNTPLCEGKIRS